MARSSAACRLGFRTFPLADMSPVIPTSPKPAFICTRRGRRLNESTDARAEERCSRRLPGPISRWSSGLSMTPATSTARPTSTPTVGSAWLPDDAGPFRGCLPAQAAWRYLRPAHRPHCRPVGPACPSSPQRWRALRSSFLTVVPHNQYPCATIANDRDSGAQGNAPAAVRRRGRSCHGITTTLTGFPTFRFKTSIALSISSRGKLALIDSVKSSRSSSSRSRMSGTASAPLA